MGILTFFFLDQNCPKLKLSTFVKHKMFTFPPKGNSKWIFKEGINHYQSFSEFSKTQGDKLEKIGPTFPSWPSAAQDIYVYS